MDVVVQPSVSWMDLIEKFKDSGLVFPIDPGPTVSLHCDIPYTFRHFVHISLRRSNVKLG